MTKEQKDKILKALVEDRNDYVRKCEDRITAEQGKIIGANYMFQRFFNVLETEVENEDIKKDSKNSRKWYLNKEKKKVRDKNV